MGVTREPAGEQAQVCPLGRREMYCRAEASWGRALGHVFTVSGVRQLSREKGEASKGVWAEVQHKGGASAGKGQGTAKGQKL